jgi:uncharacterized protein (DUF2345 family)
MTDATTTAPQPTTAQLVEAFASALLPFAGPAGILASTVMDAGLQLFANLSRTASNGLVFTMDDLEAAAKKTVGDLSQLRADVETAEAQQKLIG